jgi:hypothetical protein
MIIRGRFTKDAPYFAAYLRSPYLRGQVWFLADTGASHTALLDRDLRFLDVPAEALELDLPSIVGIGGSVRSFRVRDVKVTMASDEGDVILEQDLWAVKHDLEELPPEEAARILRIPSVLGRDIISQFRFTYDYQGGVVQLER